MIRTYTHNAIECDCCHRDNRPSGTGMFNEHPDGAGAGYYGNRIDLCDQCVLEGTIVRDGKILKKSEVEDLLAE